MDEFSVLELEGRGGYDGLTASLLRQWGPHAFSYRAAIVPTDLFPAGTGPALDGQ